MENKLVFLPPKLTLFSGKLILIEIMISTKEAILIKMDMFFLCVDPMFYINALNKVCTHDTKVEIKLSRG